MLRFLPLARLFSGTPNLAVSRTARKPIGPKSVDVFSVSDVIALLAQDFTYANSMMHILNLKTHMLGEGKCGEALDPKCESNNVALFQKLNAERLTFLVILSLRYPGIWDFAQGLVKARQNTLLQSRNQPSIYFDQIEQLLNISVGHRHLAPKELFPSSGHSAVQQIRRHAEHHFGREVRITPYTDEEIAQAEKVKDMLKEKDINLYEAFKSFNPREYLAQHAETKQATIAADTESEQTKRHSM